MPHLRSVAITVSNQKTKDSYLARSYPNDDRNNNGKIELYSIPVYMVFLDGTDARGNKVRKEWNALRFMPYWNDPGRPDKRYKARGWADSGKRKVARKIVTYYNPTYGTHNRYSPFSGAIQIDGSFLVHAGPRTLIESGWGGAGCVEIIGDFDDFKTDIRDLSGSKEVNAGDAILELVKEHVLTIEVQAAQPPNLQAGFKMEMNHL